MNGVGSMTIQQCKYVLKIAETGSFNEASKQLFIAQSTLSLSVKSLEKELDIKIFERLRNGVFLTKDGVEFVKYAESIVEQTEFVSKRYKTEKACQTLDIVTQHYDFIADIFAKMINKINDNEYRFSLREIKTHDVIHEIETGYSDIGIIAIKDNDFETMKRYLSGKDIVFTSVLKALPHVFLRKEHPLANHKKLNVSELKDFPYVAYEQGKHNISFFTEEMDDKPQNKKHIAISDRATLMNVLMITDSYTIGTGIMPSALNKGEILSIPLESEEFYIIGYIQNENKKISVMAQKFIELLIETTKKI